MQYLKYQLYNYLAILLQQFEKTPISWISQEPMAGKKKIEYLRSVRQWSFGRYYSLLLNHEHEIQVKHSVPV